MCSYTYYTQRLPIKKYLFQINAGNKYSEGKLDQIMKMYLHGKK